MTSDIGNQAAGDGERPAHHLVPAVHEGLRGREGRDEGHGAVLQDRHRRSRPRAASRSTRTTTSTSRRRARPTSGVWRYSGPFPTSADAERRLRDDRQHRRTDRPTSVRKEPFIAAGEHGLVEPERDRRRARVRAAGTCRASSPASSTSTTRDGAFVRTILEPPAGEGPRPRADQHRDAARARRRARRHPLLRRHRHRDRRPRASDPATAPAVRRIRFVDGEPQPPETMADGLAFPDGIGIFVPPTPALTPRGAGAHPA